MKHIYLLLLLALAPLCMMAQVSDRSSLPTIRVSSAIQSWDQETDTIDIDNKPKLVTGGVLLYGNSSNYIFQDASGDIRSYMKVGVEVGGFLNFNVSKHFDIQPQLLFVAEQNRLAAGDKRNLLWNFGFDIPVYFLAKWGNAGKGYLSVGGGPYMHFNVAGTDSIVQGTKHPSNTFTTTSPMRVAASEPTPDSESSSSLVLYENHAGLAGYVGYEFSFGLSISATYRIALTDIYYYATDPSNEMSVYPQKLTLGVGYRWK